MPKFRSKPVEIEAMQVCWDNWQQVCELYDRHIPENGITDMLKLHAYNIPLDEVSDTCGENELNHFIAFKVLTAHGEEAIVRHGDWLVPEKEKGRFYPIKPDIFAEKYELISAETGLPDIPSEAKFY